MDWTICSQCGEPLDEVAFVHRAEGAKRPVLRRAHLRCVGEAEPVGGESGEHAVAAGGDVLDSGIHEDHYRGWRAVAPSAS